MSFGPRVDAIVALQDTSAPGAPAFVVDPVQEGNVIRCSLRLPTTDANGGALTGLSTLAIVWSNLPLEPEASMEALLADANNGQQIVDVTGEEPGAEIEVDIPALGTSGSQYISAACSD